MTHGNLWLRFQERFYVFAEAHLGNIGITLTCACRWCGEPIAPSNIRNHMWHCEQRKKQGTVEEHE